MDNFDDLIPLIVIGLGLIGKIIKKPNKDSEKEKKEKREDDHRKKAIDFPNMKQFKEFRERIKNEIHTALDEREEILKPSTDRIIDKIDDEDYIEKDREISAKSVEAPHVEAHHEIKDMISKSEIGKKSNILDEKNIRNGIIMSEILNKPKSLRR